MSAAACIFVIWCRNSATARILGSVSACALLAACAVNPFTEAKVDPRSPVAGEVAKAARGNADYPSFQEIPPAPTDVRPLALYGREAAALDQARADLERETAPGTWALTGTDTFAAEARRAAGPEFQAPAPANTEAYARELRQRATPPPPPQR
jgi:hypothetical protein